MKRASLWRDTINLVIRATIFPLIVALISGCPTTTTQPTTAPAAYQQYHDLIRKGRTQAAWEMLTREAQDQSTSSQLRSENESESPPAAQYTAQLFQKQSNKVSLEYSDDRWHVISPLPVYRQQTTPRKTLETMERCLRLGDWTGLYALIPPYRRDGLSPEIIQNRMLDRVLRQKSEATLRLLLDSQPTAIDKNRVVFQHGAHLITIVRPEPNSRNAIWYVDDLK